MTTTPGVEAQLAVINTKLDVLIEQRTDHETRLRALERFKWLLLCAAAAGGGVAGEVTQRL